MEGTARKSLSIAVIVGIVMAVVLIVLAFLMFYFYKNENHDIAVLSDIGRIRNAFDLHAIATTHYPIELEVVELNRIFPGTQQLCTNGFISNLEQCDNVILSPIPQSYPEDVYRYQSVTNGQDYRLEFTLLRNQTWLGLQKGIQCATREGINGGRCFEQ